MLDAIDLAADRVSDSMYVNAMTRSSGLRTIRRFEAVNGISFDPFNSTHVLAVSGMARFGEVIRKGKRALD